MSNPNEPQPPYELRIIDVPKRPPRLERIPQVGDLIYINDIPCRVAAVEPVGIEAPDKFEISFYADGPKRDQS